MSVEEQIHTGEIREARLIGVVKPLKEVDEDKLKALREQQSHALPLHTCRGGV